MSKRNGDSDDAGGNDLAGNSKRVRDNDRVAADKRDVHTGCSAAGGTVANRDDKQASVVVPSMFSLVECNNRRCR